MFWKSKSYDKAAKPTNVGGYQPIMGLSDLSSNPPGAENPPGDDVEFTLRCPEFPLDMSSTIDLVKNGKIVHAALDDNSLNRMWFGNSYFYMASPAAVVSEHFGLEFDNDVLVAMMISIKYYHPKEYHDDFYRYAKFKIGRKTRGIIQLDLFDTTRNVDYVPSNVIDVCEVDAVSMDEAQFNELRELIKSRANEFSRNVRQSAIEAVLDDESNI